MKIRAVEDSIISGMEYGVQTSLIGEKTDFDSWYSCSPVHTFISHVGEHRL